MDPERERIQDDLRGLVDGPVRCDRVFTQLFASDASIFEIEPVAVVRPQNTPDVVATVHYARENNLTIHPRGAGTGTAGGCIGRGIVLDFSHSMRRIIRRDEESVTVQPGVVLNRVNEHLRPQGRMFAPDPATSAVTTIGGLLATDRGGSRLLRHGSARDHVLDMQLVLGNGEVIRVTRETPGRTTGGPSVSPRDQLTQQIGDLLERNRTAIQNARPRTLVNSSGYHLSDIDNQD